MEPVPQPMNEQRTKIDLTGYLKQIEGADPKKKYVYDVEMDLD